MSLEDTRKLLADAKEAAKEAREKGDKAKAKSRARMPRRTAVPTKVEPGWIHYEIANAILNALQERVSSKLGTPADVGEQLHLDVGDQAEEETTEGREPAELLARIIAHVMHRIPGLKKVEKRLEGRESRSGIASDIAALLAQLYRRNKHLIPMLMEVMKREAAKARAEAEAKRKGAQSQNGSATTSAGRGLGVEQTS